MRRPDRRLLPHFEEAGLRLGQIGRVVQHRLVDRGALGVALGNSAHASCLSASVAAFPAACCTSGPMWICGSRSHRAASAKSPRSNASSSRTAMLRPSIRASAPAISNAWLEQRSHDCLMP